MELAFLTARAHVSGDTYTHLASLVLLVRSLLRAVTLSVSLRSVLLYVYVRMYVYTYICTCVCVCVCVCMYICKYLCICMYMSVCMYIYGEGALVIPDTAPRGAGVEGEDSWDLYIY